MRKTMQEIKAERRREDLDDMQERIDDGSLIIRQMTADERLRMPARPRTGPGRRARPRSFVRTDAGLAVSAAGPRQAPDA